METKLLFQGMHKNKKRFKFPFELELDKFFQLINDEMSNYYTKGIYF